MYSIPDGHRLHFTKIKLRFRKVNYYVFLMIALESLNNVLVFFRPTQLYLVLDVSNLTSQEMEFHYAPGKNILIESNESCRVPVPLDRCPFNSTPPVKSTDDGNIILNYFVI